MRLNSLCRVLGGLSIVFGFACTESVPESGVLERGAVPPGGPIVPDPAAGKVLGTTTREATNAVDTQLVGATPGELTTSMEGAAQYHIDISVPPGTAGMEPKLSLDYDSSAGNELLGLGWSLTGIPKISRCPTALDPDGFIDAVDFDANDLYCLDGARLVAVVGAYGAAGTEYRTEVDSFQKVVSQGKAASGPEWFQVYTKEGRILEFGRTADSRIEAQGRADVLTWTLNRVEDRSGNFMTYTYVEVNESGVWGPSKVEYSGHVGKNIAPYARVEFAYELRSDGEIGYVSGTKVSNIARMNRVYTYVDNAPVREYRLAYDYAPVSGRSRLLSVTECGANNACLRPTRFEWGAQNTSGRGPTELFVGLENSPVAGGVSAYFDANGDGAADKVWTPCGFPTYPVCAGGTELPIYVALSNGHGFNLSTVWLDKGAGGIPLLSASHAHEGFADFDGDGLQDFFVIPFVGDNEQLYVARNTSKSFDTPKLWLGPQAGVSIRSDRGQREAMVDLDGDGRADRVWIPAGNPNEVRASLSTGQALGASQVWLRKTGPSLLSFDAKHERYIDMNADRMADRVWVPDGTNDLYVALSNGKSFDAPRVWLASGTGGVQPLSANGRHEDFADVNGDGYLDYLFIPDNTKDDLYAALSTGAGFLPPTIWLSSAVTPVGRRSSEAGPRDEQYVDFNGDGSADRVWTPYNDDTLYISLSNRISGFAAPTRQFSATRCRQRNPRPDFESATYVDITGDGTPDRLWIPAPAPEDDLPCNPAEPAQIWIVVGSPLNDRVVAITDGAAKRDEIRYVSSVEPTLYIPERPQYPQVEFRDAQTLVSELRRSDGVGAFRTATFRYGGLKNDVRRQRDLGFSFIEQFDQQRQTKITTRYNQQFPIDHTERVTETSLASNNQVLTRTTSEWRSQIVNGQGPPNVRHRVYLETTTEESFELDGKLFASRTNKRTYDDFNNVRTTESSTNDGFGKNSTYVVSNDANTWILGLVTSSTLTSTAPETPAITRSTKFDYYPTGLEKKRTIEPDTKLELVREYERDAFGNVTKESASGADIEKRSSETKYDERGRFATTLINALGQPTGQTFDSRFGTLASTTDVNKQTSTQTVNALGQPDVATDPDGTKTFNSRVYCSPSICAQNGALSVTKQRQGTAAVTSVLDALGREIQTITSGTDGRTIFTKTEFDAVGRVKATVAPYYEGEPEQRTTKEYDAYDRMTLETKPDNSKTKVDHSGNKQTSTNALNQTRTEVRNTQDHLVSVTDAYGKKTTYLYDATGNLTSVTDPISSTIVLTYDNLGRRLTITDPDLGFRKSDYDVLGQLISHVDAAGKGATFRYDVLGRQKERTEPEGITTSVYDTAENGVGKLARVYTDGKEQKAFDQSLMYDALSRVSATTTAIGGRTFTVGREYDAYGRPSAITYPSGLKVRNVYSTLGYLSKVENVATKALYWKADEYNAAGSVIRSTLGNGLSTALNINPATDRLEGVRTGTKGGAETQQLKFEWSTVGTLKGREDVNQALKESFLYDDLNRLTDATIANREPLKVKYDDAGNVKEKSDVGIYKYNEGKAGPHAVSSTDGVASVRYLYDDNGNQTARTDAEGRSLAEMRYSSFDKPIFIERDGSRSDFVYGPDRGLIVRSDTNANASRGANRVIRYVEGLFEEITDASTQAVSKRHYVRAGGRTVAVYNEGQDGSSSQAGTRYILTDHLGSIDALADETGAVAERDSFDAFGKRRNPDWTAAPVATLFSSLDKGFTGHEQLDHLGLVHMGARVYDPQIGRFTSADPTIPTPESTQGFNRYTYVDNSPLSRTDPSGFFGVDARQRFLGSQGGGRFGGCLLSPLNRSGSFFARPGGGQARCIRCFNVDTASRKEGDVAKDSARSQALGDGARPPACSGSSCSETVDQPATVENQGGKGESSTTQTRGSRPDPYTVKDRIADKSAEAELKRRQDAPIIADYVTDQKVPKRTPFADAQKSGRPLTREGALDLMAAEAIFESQRETFREKAVTFGIEGQAGVDAANGQLDDRYGNLNNVVAGLVGVGAGVLAAPSTGGTGSAVVGIFAGAGALEFGNRFIGSFKDQNQAIFDEVSKYSVVRGQVLPKAPYRAFAD